MIKWSCRLFLISARNQIKYWKWPQTIPSVISPRSDDSLLFFFLHWLVFLLHLLFPYKTGTLKRVYLFYLKLLSWKNNQTWDIAKNLLNHPFDLVSSIEEVVSSGTSNVLFCFVCVCHLSQNAPVSLSQWCFRHRVGSNWLDFEK